jgi:hypothetical protein
MKGEWLIDAAPATRLETEAFAFASSNNQPYEKFSTKVAAVNPAHHAAYLSLGLMRWPLHQSSFKDHRKAVHL